MAADDYSRYYMSGPRHAPKADVDGPDPIRQQPVANLSQPAGPTQRSVTTGAALMGKSGRRGGGGAANMSTPKITGPDLGLGEGNFSGASNIIEASGLGKKMPPTRQSNYSRERDYNSDVSLGDHTMDSDTAQACSDADPPRPSSSPADLGGPLLSRIRARLQPYPNYFDQN